MNPLFFFKQFVSPSFLGIDIGTNSIKIFESTLGKQMPRISNYIVLENQSALLRSNAAFQTSSLKIFDKDISRFLELAIKKLNPKTNEVVASLPAFSAFLTVLNFPDMPAAEVDKMMKFQAKQYIPMPLSEVAIEWSKVGEYVDDKGFKFQQILLISVPQEQIRKYQEIMKSVGLKLKVLEVESLSLARSLVGRDPTGTMIVDIGSFSTSILVVAAGQLKYAIQTDYAGASITQAITTSLSVNPLRAEELKKEKGLIGTGGSYELSTVMMPMVDVILNEVRRAQKTFEAQFQGAPKIERIILSGGGANLPGLEKYASDQLGIPSVKASPFSKFEYDPLLEPVLRDLNPLASVALGLGLRELI